MRIRHRNPRLWKEILLFGTVCKPSDDKSREGEKYTMPDGTEIILEGNGSLAHDAEGNSYCASYRLDGGVKVFVGYVGCTRLSSAADNAKEENK